MKTYLVVLAFCVSTALCGRSDWLRYRGPGPVIPARPYQLGNCTVYGGTVFDNDGTSRSLTDEEAQELSKFHQATYLVVLAFCVSAALCGRSDWLRYRGPGPVRPYQLGNCTVYGGTVFDNDGTSRSLTDEEAQELSKFHQAVDQWQ
uniref:Pepsin-I3 domain-containing protein n=1 Tax=Steinernema glaseri TaxID=37863 RepID=A0A1I7YNX6_9BILA